MRGQSVNKFINSKVTQTLVAKSVDYFVGNHASVESNQLISILMLYVNYRLYFVIGCIEINLPITFLNSSIF